MKVKVKMNKPALRQLTTTQVQALILTGDALKTEVMTAAVVPKQTGELERSAFVDETFARKGRVKLIYDTPYARRLYHHPEYDFRQDKNANASGKWLVPWISGDKKDFAPKAFRALYRRLNGGLIK